jgi:hypothetical protein
LFAIWSNPPGAYAAGRADAYRPGPAPAAGAQSPVRVLPNFDVVALGGLSPSEALLLDAFATRFADHLWTLPTASLLKALPAGRGLEDVRVFGRLRHPLDQQLVPAEPPRVLLGERVGRAAVR